MDTINLFNEYVKLNIDKTYELKSRIYQIIKEYDETTEKYKSYDMSYLIEKISPDILNEACKCIEKGYDIVNAYHEYTYLDYSYEKIPLKKAYQFNPIPEGLTPEQRNHVLGISCQMWGEFTPTVESMNRLLFPRIAAYAETGWCQEKNKNYQMFSKALENDKKLQIK